MYNNKNHMFLLLFAFFYSFKKSHFFLFVFLSYQEIYYKCCCCLCIRSFCIALSHFCIFFNAWVLFSQLISFTVLLFVLCASACGSRASIWDFVVVVVNEQEYCVNVAVKCDVDVGYINSVSVKKVSHSSFTSHFVIV